MHCRRGGHILEVIPISVKSEMQLLHTLETFFSEAVMLEGKLFNITRGVLSMNKCLQQKTFSLADPG